MHWRRSRTALPRHVHEWTRTRQPTSLTTLCGSDAAPYPHRRSPVEAARSRRRALRASDNFQSTINKKDTMIDITPNPKARRLFSKLVARADDNMIVDLSAAMSIAVERMNAGEPPMAHEEISELMHSGWLIPAPQGGWSV